MKLLDNKVDEVFWYILKNLWKYYVVGCGDLWIEFLGEVIDGRGNGCF